MTKISLPHFFKNLFFITLLLVNFFFLTSCSHLTNYLRSNKLETLDGEVLTHINGFDVTDQSFSQTEILVPTKLFTNYFSIESISFKRTTTKRKVNGCTQKYYRARYKDSLISIARKYDIKMDNLKEMNNGVRFVRPGMQIRLCN